MGSVFVVIACLLVLPSFVLSDNVFKFDQGLDVIDIVTMSAENHIHDDVLSEEWMRYMQGWAKRQENLGIKPELTASTFKWDDCGITDLIHVYNVSVTPDPIVLPGTFKVGFNATATTDVVSPFLSHLLVEYRVAGKYIKLPCVDQFGSCTYEDLCTILAKITDCPKFIVDLGSNCHCPLKKNKYLMKPSPITINSGLFPGYFHFRADIQNAPKQALCLDLFLELKG